jgi:hypothetical protein
MSEEAQVEAEAVTDENVENSNIPKEIELSPQDIQEFISQTHHFVTQMHLEQSAVLNVLLSRALITTEELNQAYQDVREGYQQEVINKQMEAAVAAGLVPPPSGSMTEEEHIHNLCGVDVCGGGCESSEEGRQRPTTHGV